MLYTRPRLPAAALLFVALAAGARPDEKPIAPPPRPVPGAPAEKEVAPPPRPVPDAQRPPPDPPGPPAARPPEESRAVLDRLARDWVR